MRADRRTDRQTDLDLDLDLDVFSELLYALAVRQGKGRRGAGQGDRYFGQRFRESKKLIPAGKKSVVSSKSKIKTTTKGGHFHISSISIASVSFSVVFSWLSVQSSPEVEDWRVPQPITSGVILAELL